MITKEDLRENISSYRAELTRVEELFENRYGTTPISHYNKFGLTLTQGSELKTQCASLEEKIHYAEELLDFLQENEASKVTGSLLSKFLEEDEFNFRSKNVDLINSLVGA